MSCHTQPILRISRVQESSWWRWKYTKKTWFGWIKTSGCHQVIYLTIPFPEESRSSTEVQHFQMSFEYLQEWKLHNFSGQSFPPLKNPYDLLFPYVELEFPFLQQMSAALSFSLCVSEKGPALSVFTVSAKLVLGPCKTISSQAAHAKIPQAVLAHGMPQFPAILVASY